MININKEALADIGDGVFKRLATIAKRNGINPEPFLPGTCNECKQVVRNCIGYDKKKHKESCLYYFK